LSGLVGLKIKSPSQNRNPQRSLRPSASKSNPYKAHKNQVIFITKSGETSAKLVIPPNIAVIFPSGSFREIPCNANPARLNLGFAVGPKPGHYHARLPLQFLRLKSNLGLEAKALEKS